MGADIFEADASVIAFLNSYFLNFPEMSQGYIWFGESREWMSVTLEMVDRGSRKMGWRGEEVKARLQERVEEVEEESPLHRER